MDSGWRALVRLPVGLGPQIFEIDEATGSVLMERLRPGTSLAGLDCDAESIFASLALGLRGVSAEGMLPLRQFVTPSPLADLLLATSPEPVFLHGDLHHYNIIRGQRGWRIIDPKGVVGDPAYEAAAFVRNPIETIGDEPDLPGSLRRRIDRLASLLKLERARIWGWSLVGVSSTDRDANDPWAKVELALRSLSEEYSAELGASGESSTD
jgi:streptomycin 6-kinase